MMECKKILIKVEKSEFAQLFKNEKNIQTISYLKKTYVSNVQYNPTNDENLSFEIVNMIIQKVDKENQKKCFRMQTLNNSTQSNFKIVPFKVSKTIDISEKFAKDKNEIHQSSISVNMYEKMKDMYVPQKRNFDNEYSVKKELEINQDDKVCKMSCECKIPSISDENYSNNSIPKTETNETNYRYNNNKRYNNFYRYDRGYKYQNYHRRNYSSNYYGYYYNSYQPKYSYNRSQSYDNYYYY